MIPGLYQVERLISVGARCASGGDPALELDSLRQVSILLLRAREEVERRTILELRAQSERPLQDSFPLRLRDATIALCEAVETRDHMAGRSDPERAARWGRRVDRAKGRILRVVRDELRRGVRP